MQVPLSQEQIAELKKQIVELFRSNVKGKSPDVSSYNTKHDGKEGHWLEAQMGIKANADNLPDILGFEMKKSTATKTTFGDWSANYYLFKDKTQNITRDEFLSIFGKANALKGGRFSWSGEPFPKIGRYNGFGQIMEIGNDGDIVIKYNYSEDLRTDKSKIVPVRFQLNSLELARWNSESLKAKLEKKFNVYGWFKCEKNKEGVYDRILFGDPITYENWIRGVINGDVYLDSGMYAGNIRPYSNWRANNSYWDSLIVEAYS